MKRSVEIWEALRGLRVNALLVLLVIFFIPSRAYAKSGADGGMKDGEYSVSVDLSGGSGKASVMSPTILTVKNGTPYARIQWSSPNYDYMIVDGVRYENQSGEGMNSVFEIPALVWDAPMEAVADTTAMGSPIEINYRFIFYKDTIGEKSELPQEAAKRVLFVAFAIIVIGGILNYMVKKRYT